MLAIYAAMRAGLPLLTRRLPLVPVNVGLLSLSAVLYACCPAVVRELPIAWLIAASTLTGASFAGTSTLRNLLALEMYGAADLANVLPLLEVGVGLGKFVGPVTGYYIYLADAEGGDESHSAYDPFFYACAAVVRSPRRLIFTARPSIPTAPTTTTADMFNNAPTRIMQQ